MFIATYATLKYIAPLGAKLGRVTFVGTFKALALLRSSGLKMEPPGYKHLTPPGQKRQTMLCCTSKLNPNEK
jgi:hypothetical protein